LKPSAIAKSYRMSASELAGAGVIWTGNLVATRTLALLALVSLVLVAGLIFTPLWRAGLPEASVGRFAASALYFALIGSGYMMVQVPFMQRFSVYLGHPTYSIAVILFAMILSTGIGAALSDAFPFERRPSWLVAAPLATAATLLAVTLSIQPIIDSTIQCGLATRCILVAGLAAVVSLPLGLWFPVGLRLLARVSDRAAPWMWGINGACGVMASILVVAMSMWYGIDVSLYTAAAAYAALLLPARVLWKGGQSAGELATPTSAANTKQRASSSR